MLKHRQRAYSVRTVKRRFFRSLRQNVSNEGFSEYRSFKTDFNRFLIRSNRNDAPGVYHFSINFIAFLLYRDRCSSLLLFNFISDLNQFLKQKKERYHSFHPLLTTSLLSLRTLLGMASRPCYRLSALFCGKSRFSIRFSKFQCQRTHSLIYYSALKRQATSRGRTKET